MQSEIKNFLISIAAGLTVSILFKVPLLWIISQLDHILRITKELKTDVKESNKRLETLSDR